jgi:DNA-binding response OmpR family regulator
MGSLPLILIIEDATEIASIFAEILALSGMKADVIHDGQVALERLQKDTPDLVLLDMHLPHVSGLQLLAYIRAEARLKHTKVVAVTANALLARDLEDQADLTLIKPVSFTQISELCSRMLRAVPKIAASTGKARIA